VVKLDEKVLQEHAAFKGSHPDELLPDGAKVAGSMGWRDFGG